MKFQFDDLEVRSPEKGDAEVVYAAVCDSLEALKAYMVWAHGDYTLESARAWTGGATDQLLVFQQGRLVHVTGFRRGESINPRAAKLGYWTPSQFQGRGLAVTMTRILTVIGFEQLRFDRLEIDCGRENLGSVKVAERAGYRLEGELCNGNICVRDVGPGFTTDQALLIYGTTPQEARHQPWYDETHKKIG